MDGGTQKHVRSALLNFTRFCESEYKHSLDEVISEFKKHDELVIFNTLQEWYNSGDLAYNTKKTYFNQIRSYLYYMGFKITPQDVKHNIKMPKKPKEEKYPLQLSEIHKILGELEYKDKVETICQLSSLIRRGELLQLKKKHLILVGQRYMVKIPTSIAKFAKARTTFFSIEASKMLGIILKKLDDDDVIFGTHEQPEYSYTNAAQKLRSKLDKLGLGMRYETTNEYKINTHSFRAYGRTKLSRRDRDFSMLLAGQEGYDLKYDRLTDEEKLDLYIELEPDLLIYDLTRKDEQIKKLKDATTKNRGFGVKDGRPGKKIQVYNREYTPD